METEQFGPSHMLFGIEAAARATGHLLSFVTLSRTGKDMASTLEHLRASHVEGVIVVAPVRAVVDAVASVDDQVPLVVVGGDPRISAATVTIDQLEGARIATRHLLRARAPDGPPRAGTEELDRRHIEDAGVDGRPADPRRPAREASWWVTGARVGATPPAARLAADPKVTAVFAANDQTALGVIRALHDAGRKVPEDVSVVGFDDTPESGYFVPALTTVRQDFGEVGRRCVELLLSLMDGQSRRTPHRRPRRAGRTRERCATRRISAAETRPAPDVVRRQLRRPDLDVPSPDEALDVIQRTTLTEDDHRAAASTAARACAVDAGRGQCRLDGRRGRRVAEADRVVAGMAGTQQMSQTPRSSLAESSEASLAPGVLLDAEGGGGAHRVRLVGSTTVSGSPRSPHRPTKSAPSTDSGRSGHR